MSIEIFGDEVAANEILELTNLWDQSLEQCDADSLTANYAEFVNVFDIGNQLTSRNKIKALWQSCFGFFGKSPKVFRSKLKIYASSDLAFIHCYSKICGSKMPNPEEQPWCRTTVCYQKIESNWTVVHEHISMPIDFEKGAPSLIFDI